MVPDEQRAQALNLNYWAMNIGFAGAATLSGLLADQPRVALFAIDAVSTLSAGLLVVLPGTPAPAARNRTRSPATGGLGTVFARPHVHDLRVAATPACGQ